MKAPYRNERMLNFMTGVEVNTLIVDRFNKSKYKIINHGITRNFYSIDELGLPIRREMEGKDNEFGWKRVGNKFYHFRVNDEMIGYTSNEELRKITLQSIIQKWPKNRKEDSNFYKKLMAANEEMALLE